MKKLDEILKGMNDKELRRVQCISIIIAILGEIGILVVCTVWFDKFDNTFGHIFIALIFIITFHLILELIDDISYDIYNDKRLKKKRRDEFNNKIIILNDYKKYKKGE